jgi:predicted TIM-barrel fold metal-dependent hydrolase
MNQVLTSTGNVLADAAQAAASATFAPSRVPQVEARPERRARRYTVISVDDHLVEPPDLFEGRLPAKFRDREPRVVEADDGSHVWVLDGTVLSQIAINAVAGQQKDEAFVEPTRFDMVRPGAYDVHQRVADMDTDGLYASLNFPSLVGFAGVRLQGLPDQEFALATVRAWNDWHIEEWCGPYPDRLIPCQIPWLNDAELAADEIRRNADRGFKAVTFPELPGKLGFEQLSSEFWDPFWQACEETDTVICVHTGSSGLPALSEGTDSVGAIFGAGYAMLTTMEWLFARMALRFPGLKICMSEGGIGWVAGVLDRLDHAEHYRDAQIRWEGAVRPADVFRRNFWFCTLNDPSAMPQRYRIGLDRIMFEVDYPHADTSWPDTQARIHSLIGELPEDEANMIAWRNAAELFRHPVPATVQADPNTFGR